MYPERVVQRVAGGERGDEPVGLPHKTGAVEGLRLGAGCGPVAGISPRRPLGRHPPTDHIRREFLEREPGHVGGRADGQGSAEGERDRAAEAAGPL